MFVSEIMSTCVAECTEDTRLEEVYDHILKCEHGLVVVVDSLAHRVPIGVVTERSICEQIIARGRNPRSLSAGSVIDSRVKKVKAGDLIETIASGVADVAAVLVVDENRRACGVVSKEKLQAAASSVYVEPTMVVDSTELPMTASVAPASRRVSEIPAFGWIQ